MNHLKEYNGQKVWVSRKFAETIEVMSMMRGGGFAHVVEYEPSTDYVEKPLVNITFISKFSTAKLYERKSVALGKLTFSDLTIKGDKLETIDGDAQKTLFAECVAKMVGSMQKTLDGDRSDAHRQGHDRCYVVTSQGVKLHLETVKGPDGHMVPVLTDGHPTAKSIMVPMIETMRSTVKEGVKKTVKNGAKVQMDKCIERSLNARSVSYRTLSLKEDNFKTLKMDGEEFTVANIFSQVRDTVRLIDAKDLAEIIETEEKETV